MFRWFGKKYRKKLKKNWESSDPQTVGMGKTDGVTKLSCDNGVEKPRVLLNSLGILQCTGIC